MVQLNVNGRDIGLDVDPTTPIADIDSAMSGNLCRCGTYQRIRAAIKDGAATLA